MRQRCFNKNHPDFKYYGGRGITICKRWDDYANFLADMGEAPKGLTLDRTNNQGHYEPSNCQWRTRKDQANNTRKQCPVEQLLEIEPIPVDRLPVDCLLDTNDCSASNVTSVDNIHSSFPLKERGQRLDV